MSLEGVLDDRDAHGQSPLGDGGNESSILCIDIYSGVSIGHVTRTANLVPRRQHRAEVTAHERPGELG